MKLTIQSTALLAVINLAKPAVGVGMPILSCVLLTAADGKLTVTANNLDTWIAADSECQTEAEGSAVINASRLADVIGAMGDCELTISADKKHVMQIRRGASIIALAGLPPDEFPPLEQAKDGAKFTLPRSEFRAAMLRVLPFVSNDQTRYVICGPLLECNGKGVLNLVATNGRILRTSAIDCGASQFSGVVPSAAARMLAGLCDGGGDVSILMASEMIAASADNWRAASKLIEGNYPNYRQTIPVNTKPITGERAELLHALVMTEIACRNSKSTTTVKLTFGARCSAAASGADIGTADIELAGWRSKRDLAIAFDPIYLRAGIKSFSREEIGLQFVDEMSPLKIEDESGIFVCMPMRIS